MDQKKTGWDKDFYYSERPDKRLPRFSVGYGPAFKRIVVGFQPVVEGDKFKTLKQFRMATAEEGMRIVETKLLHLSAADLEILFEEGQYR